MTAQELIRAALRSIGAIATGETPSNAELIEGLEALNIMLRSWSVERLLVYTLTENTHTLVAGTGSYTIGDGADIDTTRPTRILNAYHSGSGIDKTLEIIGEAKYNGISTKTTGGTPSMLYYNPGWTTGTIYLWPVPESALTLYIFSIKPFSSSAGGDLVTGITSTVSFPPEYDRPIKYNLAIELAPEYGRELSPAIVNLAAESKTKLKALNAANQVQPVSLEILRLARTYRIDEG